MDRALGVAVQAGMVPLAGGLSFALAFLQEALAGVGAALSTAWLGNGVIVALLLRRPTRQWPALLAAGWAGTLCAGLAGAGSTALMGALAAADLVEIALVAACIRFRLGGSAPFASLGQLKTLALAALAAPALTLPLVALALTVAGPGLSPTDLSMRFAADALGIVILVPLLVAATSSERTATPGRRVEFALLLAIALAGALWIFTRHTSSIFLLTPVLLFAALRLPMARAALLTALTAAAAIATTATGLGPLAALDPVSRGLLLQVFVATAVMLTLPIAALRQEQARTAAALRLREEHYRLLADNSSDLVLRLSAAGEADYVSSAASRLLGLPAQALAGPALAARIHPEDQPRFATALDRARRSGEAITCFRMRHARGHDRWVEAHMRLAGPSGAPLPGPGASPVAASGGSVTPVLADWPVVGTLRDIHDRRIAELRAVETAARLRESNRLLMMAEGLASLGHWIFDRERHELILSAQAATVLNLAQLTIPVDEMLGLLQPADRRPLLRALARARGREEPVECTVRLDEGEGMRTLQLRIQQTGAGEGASLFGVISDITAKLRSELQLIAAVEEARSAANFRSQFLATMSHEIRTPMTGVIGMIELLEAGPTPAEQKLYLQTLRQSGDLLMAVLNDILDFSKVDAGRITIADEPFDLGATLLTTLRLYDRTASARGLELKLEGPAPGALWLRGDAVRLRQVLSNLLSNAIKFSERGEVTLRCAIQSITGARHRLRLSVIDQGIGISPALRARLFEPFVQGAEGVEGAAAGGTGLGLAISRRLIEAMGGNIHVQSRPGHGTTFTIALALADAAPAASLESAAVRAPAAPLDILLAEDNPVNQLLVTALCKRLGHRVTAAADGDAVVAAAAARRFDLILMDMQMPRCDGLTAARRIRSGGGPCADVPIVALTADASSAQRPRYAEAGLDGLLTKPIDSAAFARTLAELAERPRGRQRQRPALPSPAPGEGPSPLDPGTLEELRALLGAARLDQLLDLLAAELDQRPLAIRAALADRDFAAAASEAHSLKGAAANLGAHPVGDAAGEVERSIAAAAAADPRLLAASLRNLAAEVSLAQQAIALLRRSTLAEAVDA